MKHILIILASLLIITSCSQNMQDDPYQNETAQQIFQAGTRALVSGNHERAIKTFRALEAHFPYGEFTESAQLCMLYAQYMDEDFEQAMRTATRFIRLHPNGKHTDYAYYMRGMIKFNEDVSFLERNLPIEPSRRDTTHEKESFSHFLALVNTFPHSKYSADARLRLRYLRNVLAEKELHIARHYYERQAYLASANRAANVVAHFDQAASMPDALALMQHAYEALHLKQFATDVHRVRMLNYPGYTE